MSTTKYALVTPARNEEAYIEKTLQSVTTQTVLPQKWVIVSDGSTDGTDSIVQEYAQKHTFIRLIRKSCDQKRTFSSKINAFETGCEHLQSIDYDFIGMLDADVSFGPDYYEKVLDRFAQNEKLGVVGGIRYDLVNGKFVHVLCAENSVGGPYQLFRRACFEQIGGFPAIAIGGEDAVAEIKARMLGWQVQSFPALEVYHYRRTGTATKGALSVHFQDGQKCYLLGYHPLFQIVKSIYRMQDRPYIIGGLCLLAGYLHAAIRRVQKPVSREFIAFLRKEQLTRVKALFKVTGVRYQTQPL